MTNGFIYLIKRNKSDIKILYPIEIDKKISSPNPFTIIGEEILAKGIFETIKLNKLEWESYAENGTVEQIIKNWNKLGAKIPVGKYHPIIRQNRTNTVSQIFDLGKIPTGRKPNFN